jgi:hypothetical protein
LRDPFAGSLAPVAPHQTAQSSHAQQRPGKIENRFRGPVPRFLRESNAYRTLPALRPVFRAVKNIACGVYV